MKSRDVAVNLLRLARAAALCLAALLGCSDTTAPRNSTGDPGGDDGAVGPSQGTGELKPLPYTVAKALAANQADHEAAGDYTWSSLTGSAVFNGSSITVSGSGLKASGSKLTISAAGTYRLSGKLDNGQVVVETDGSALVRLVLSGVDLTCASCAPIYAASAKKTVLILADSTVNLVRDGASYAATGADDPNAAIFSKDDLSIGGNGALTVDGSYKDGITSKDGLVIRGGTLNVTARDDGIRGKDYAVVLGGRITVKAGGDGLKSDNDSDATAGYVRIADGTLDITSGADAVQGHTDVLVSGGTLKLTTGGGSTKTVTGTATAKGLKAGVMLVFEGATATIDGADDALHSNTDLAVNSGTLTLATADDAIHSDSTLGVNGGEITVTKSYEGLESHGLVIAGGILHILASDDGLNGSTNNDPEVIPGLPAPAVGTNYLYILGGYLVANASGDGADINGSIVQTGGTFIVHGPTAQNNGAIDYDGTYAMSGGTLVAAGANAMAMAPSASSTVYSLLVRSTFSRPASMLFHIQTAAGQDVLTFKSARMYGAVAFASPLIKKGTTYQVYIGGSCTGTVVDGVYTGGTYSGGTYVAEVTPTSPTTTVNF